MNSIASLNSLFSFNLSFESVNSEVINDFIGSSMDYIIAREYLSKHIYLFLANEPKNRSKFIKRYQ